MNMSILKNNKIEYQNQLNNIFQKYFIKYLDNLYEESDKIKDFQRVLLKIPNWKDYKIDKEYVKFLEYALKKYNLNENDLTQILTLILELNIKMLSSYYIEFKIPDLKTFWYKCAKLIGKYIYEDPNIIKSHSYNEIRDLITKAIEYILQKYTPIKDILSQNKKTITSEPISEKNSYNFQNQVSENSVISKKDISEKDPSLKYISDDELDNVYYYSGNENENNNNELSNDEEKHIKLPIAKLNKKPNYFKKKRTVVEASFFDNII